MKCAHVSSFTVTLVLLASAVFILTPPTYAATWQVTNLNDSGSGSLREAINSANNDAGGDTISFAPGLAGTIHLASILWIAQQVTITGSPGVVIDGGGQVTYLIVVNNANGTQISGLTLSGAVTVSIAIQRSTGVQVTNSTISGGMYGVCVCCYSQACLEGNSISNVSVSGIRGARYYDLTVPTSPTSLTIVNNDITGFGNAGIDLQNQSTGTITGNTIGPGQGTGVMVQGGATAGGIQGNTIVSCAVQGIAVSYEGTSAGSIESNTISGCGDGIVVASGAQVGTISSNTISSCSLCGIILNPPSQAGTISSNKISDCVQDGIDCCCPAVGTIQGNQIARAGMDGIEVKNPCNVQTTGAADITDNTVQQCGAHGIDVHQGAVAGTIGANTITGCTAAGISVSCSGQATMVSSNTISDNGWDGIACCQGAIGTIQGNQIARSSSNGIEVHVKDATATATAGTIQDNQVAGSGSNGIAVVGEGASVGSVESNTFSSSGTGIVLAFGAQAKTISSNTITSCSGCGILLNPPSQAGTISNNTISDCVQDGIDCCCPAVGTIQGNQIARVGMCGIDYKNPCNVLTSGAADITDNNVEQCGMYGILVQAGGVAGTIGSNTISNCAADGIALLTGGSSLGTMENNTIQNCSAHGIEVNGENTRAGTIKSNTISGCASNGIWVTSSAKATTISSNTISGCTSCGILVTSSAQATTISSNTISDNGSDGIACDGGSVGTIQGNQIAGSGTNGLILHGEGASAGSVENNTVTGSGATGIVCCGGADATIQGNNVSGSGGTGVLVAGSTARVTNNTINDGTGPGVHVCAGSTAQVSLNTIYNNSGAGVLVLDTGTCATISQNSIYGNGQLGIDLVGDGIPLPNVPGGYGVGPNCLINYPVVTASKVGAHASVSGTAPPNCTIEVFTAAPDPSGYGQGKTYISSSTSDGSGNFTVQFSGNEWPITMTATDAAGNTSEFSACSTPNPPPTVTSITPNTGVRGSSVSITNLAGTGFLSGATVQLQMAGQTAINATGVTVVSATQITCSFDLTGAALGAWDVVVTNTDTQSGTLPGGFTVSKFANPAPTVTSITPNTGVKGSSVSITNLAGTGFLSGATVQLQKARHAAINATDVTVISATQITCSFDLKGAAVGAWDVVVTNTDTQSGTLSGGFTVTMRPPVARPGPDRTVEANTTNGANVTLDGSHSRDPRGGALTYTWSEGATVLAGPSGNATATVFLPLGTHTITLQVTDPLGLTGTADVTITVVDTRPPTITAPAAVTAEATGPGGAVVTLGAPTVSDICDPAPVVTNNAPAMFPLGRTIVTWTATDASGNKATAKQEVKVVDTTPPTIKAPLDVAAEANCTNGARVALGTPTVSDLVDPAPKVTNDAPKVFPLGLTTVTWTATDDSGNKATAQQKVTVVDTTPPSMTLTVLQANLWPPKHKLVLVAKVSQVKDICDPDPIVSIVVSCNETTDPSNWSVVKNGNVWEIWVMSDCLGTGSGRDYTIDALATDASGNATDKKATITVAHD